MGGTAVLPMFKLASQVDVPEWIVNIRHEAAHGISLPSIQILRLAADFIKKWLKVCKSQCRRFFTGSLATNLLCFVG